MIRKVEKHLRASFGFPERGIFVLCDMRDIVLFCLQI